MSSAFLAHFITAPYAASKKQPISSGGFLEWLWQIRGTLYKMSSAFLAHFITAPYAASKKQPISSGGFLEWLWQIRGTLFKMSSAFLLILLRHLMPLSRNSQSSPAVSWSGSGRYKMRTASTFFVLSSHLGIKQQRCARRTLPKTVF